MASKLNNKTIPLAQLKTNDSDTVFDFCCTLCENKKLNKEATKLCVNCQQYLCKNCLENHNNFPVLSKHVLTDPEKTTIASSPTKPGSSRQTQQMMPTERCKLHNMELIVMYCGNEDVVGCSICFMKQHKSCDDTHYIPEYAPTNLPAELVQEVNDDLTKAIQKIKNKIKVQQDGLGEKFEQSRKKCQQEIQHYRDYIDNIEKNALNELETKYTIAKQELKDKCQDVKVVYDELLRFKSELLSEETNDSQRFVLIKLYQDLLRQLSELLSKQSLAMPENLEFTTNTNMLGSLFSQTRPLTVQAPSDNPDKRQHQPLQTGTSTTANKTTIITEAKLTNQIQHMKRGLYKVAKASKRNIQQYFESECNIFSSCILPNGNIVLADTSNKKLKLVDSRSYKVKSYLKLTSAPLSVCNLRDSEIAVCLNDKRIEELSVKDDTLKSIRCLLMNHYCKGIAVVNEVMYVGSLDKLYAYPLNGGQVSTIGKNPSEKGLFSNIQSIAVSDNGTMIHIADVEKGVITMDVYDCVKWKYSGREFGEGWEAWGVCTDGKGGVFVCDGAFVIQLKPDGRLVGIVAKPSDGMVWPKSVCYDQKSFAILVAGYDNNMTVFGVN